MADPRGFLKVRERELPKSRPVPVRIRDFSEVHEPQDPRALKRQASRCMDCGIPFCHSACPLGNLIPEWNDLVWKQDWQEASDRLHATNNFPDFTGRLCPAPCEYACVLGINQPPITIKNIEHNISDEAFRRDLVKPQIPAFLTGNTVAVIGSGPAGLATAQQLTRIGHTVAVYERSDRVGGLLRYGIPNFKLEDQIIERRLTQMQLEGTRFRAGVDIGTDITGAELKERYAAIVLALGSTICRDLPVPRRELGGIHQAMDYLTQSTRRVLGDPVVDPIDAKGKDVVIIGGGDTGADCLGTAIRQGAASVTSLEITECPPLMRSQDDPWPTFPKLFKVASAHEEGGDRVYSTSTLNFISNTGAASNAGAVPNDVGSSKRSGSAKDSSSAKDSVSAKDSASVKDSGTVTGIQISEVEFQEGQFHPIAGTERTLPAQLVLLAMGFVGVPRDGIVEQLGVEVDSRGRIERDDQWQTSARGVFVAGDAGRGQSLIVWAIAEGRSTAVAVDQYLRGTSELVSSIGTNDVQYRP